MTRHANVKAKDLATAPTPQPPLKSRKHGGRPKKKFVHPGPDAIPTSQSLDVTSKAAYQRMFDADESSAHLRWQAKLAYTTDINQCTVEDIAKIPRFQKVSLTHLKKWCWTDGWHDERIRFLADLQKRMELAISDEVTRQRLSYLRAIKPAVESALKKFVPHPFEQYQPDPEGMKKPSAKKPICKVCGRYELGHDDPFFGLEGDRVVNSLVKLVELDLTLSEVVARAVSGSPTSGKVQDGTDGNPPLASTVTTEEARIAAHAILRKRRAAIVAPRTEEPHDAGGGAGGDAMGSSAAPDAGDE